MSETEREATGAETASGEPEAVEVLDEAAESEEAAAGEPDAKQLQLLLEDARTKADENWDQVLRVRAELENLRKRHERDLEAARKYALDTFVSELLQVRDSLELGLQAAEDGTVDAEKLREGTALTLKLLGDVMGKFGVERIDPQGQPFNPDLHQAMTLQPRDDVPPNTVVSVIQKGYTLNGRLVRPALVMVSQAAA